jgi:hypothetical protein
LTATIYLLTLCLPLATILIVFGMRYFATLQQAKARLAQDQAWRQIAEKAAAAEVETASALGALQAALSEVRNRLGAIEKVLKEVE